MPWWATLFFALCGVIVVSVAILAWIDDWKHRGDDQDDTWRDDYTGWG